MLNHPILHVLIINANLVLCSILNINRRLEVANGRAEFLTKRHLSFDVRPGDICKVEVVQNEPIYQRVGKITPAVRFQFL